MSPLRPPRDVSWSAPVHQLELDVFGVDKATGAPLGAWLHEDDRAAGVDDELLTCVRRHHAVRDARRVRQADGTMAWTDLHLRVVPDGLVLQLCAARGAWEARRIMRDDNAAATRLRSAIRHDLYAPLATVAGALELLEGDLSSVATDDIHALLQHIRTSVQACADRTESLGQRPEPSGAAQWVDCRVLVDDALLSLRAEVQAAEVCVTRGVLPAVFTAPEPLWACVVRGIRDALPLGRPGGHLHLQMTHAGDGWRIDPVVVRPPAAPAPSGAWGR